MSGVVLKGNHTKRGGFSNTVVLCGCIIKPGSQYDARASVVSQVSG